MTSPSFRGMEQLSAYIDGQLSQSKRTRLEIRIQSDPALAAALDELRQTRTLLRRIPQHHAPRNFTLTPRMAGIRPPLPRAVLALTWASAVAMLLFVCTLGTNLLGQLSFGASAPMLASAPNGIGGGPAAAATAAPATMAPATQLTSDQTLLATPTVEAFVMPVPEATPPGATRVPQPPLAPKAQHGPFNPWPYIWLGLAGLLLGTAMLVRWLNQRAFRKKLGRK